MSIVAIDDVDAVDVPVPIDARGSQSINES